MNQRASLISVFTTADRCLAATEFFFFIVFWVLFSFCQDSSLIFLATADFSLARFVFAGEL